MLFWLSGGFFFFKQKTAYEMRISDWSSDVCSSDLAGLRVRRSVGRIWKKDQSCSCLLEPFVLGSRQALGRDLSKNPALGTVLRDPRPRRAIPARHERRTCNVQPFNFATASTSGPTDSLYACMLMVMRISNSTSIAQKIGRAS